MKNCTLVASTVNDEGLWLAEIIEVEGCITQGKDLQEVVQRAKELREAIDTIKGLQFNEEEPAEDIQEKNEDDALGYFVSHKNKANGSICSNISEVLEIIKEFDFLLTSIGFSILGYGLCYITLSCTEKLNTQEKP